MISKSTRYHGKYNSPHKKKLRKIQTVLPMAMHVQIFINWIKNQSMWSDNVSKAAAFEFLYSAKHTDFVFYFSRYGLLSIAYLPISKKLANFKTISNVGFSVTRFRLWNLIVSQSMDKKKMAKKIWDTPTMCTKNEHLSLGCRFADRKISDHSKFFINIMVKKVSRFNFHFNL